MNRTVVGLAAIVGLAILAGAVAAIAGIGGFDGVGGLGGPPGELDHRWTATVDTAYDDNHHDLAAVTVDGEPVVAAPVNDLDGGDGCGLVALDADGSERWTFDIPPDACTPHAIGDAGAGDRTGDGPEFLVGTETYELVALDAADGTVTLRHDLRQIGYSTPAVADLSGDGSPETVAVDFGGTVHVLDDDGNPLWVAELEGTAPVAPLVADLSGDGDPEVAVVQRTGGAGEVVVFDGGGDERWRAAIHSPATSWTVADRENGSIVIVSTGRDLVALDGADGSRLWIDSSAESRINVGPAAGGVVFAAGDGTVRAVDVIDGDVVWTREFEGDVNAAAPVAGDVTGDGDPELAVAFRDGTVAILDPESGDVLARETVRGPIHVSPLLVDLTGDGSQEVVLGAGDGRVETYAYDELD